MHRDAYTTAPPDQKKNTEPGAHQTAVVPQAQSTPRPGGYPQAKAQTTTTTASPGPKGPTGVVLASQGPRDHTHTPAHPASSRAFYAGEQGVRVAGMDVDEVLKRMCGGGLDLLQHKGLLETLFPTEDPGDGLKSDVEACKRYLCAYNYFLSAMGYVMVDWQTGQLYVNPGFGEGTVATPELAACCGRVIPSLAALGFRSYARNLLNMTIHQATVRAKIRGLRPACQQWVAAMCGADETGGAVYPPADCQSRDDNALYRLGALSARGADDLRATALSRGAKDEEIALCNCGICVRVTRSDTEAGKWCLVSECGLKRDARLSPLYCKYEKIAYARQPAAK